MQVAIVHDYLTQRGGAERVVLSIAKAFPGAPIYTSLYDARSTFPAFGELDVRTMPLNYVVPLRRFHRLALPLLAPAFSRLRVSADVAICSSSGWAHGASVRGRKIVYCHAPARWLYQSDRYLGERRGLARASLGALRRPLVSWDRRAAATADRYLTNSTAVRDSVRSIYGIDADVLPPPPAVDGGGAQVAVPGLEPGFFLCVSRLLPYKNVDAVVDAFRNLEREALVVVGVGPESGRLRARARDNVAFLGTVGDDELRWLYAHCRALVAASFEDYGLTPLEAAAFGKPTVALRAGGFLDTVVDGTTGVFFDRPTAAEIEAAVSAAGQGRWDADLLRDHADAFSEASFVRRLRAVVDEVAGEAGGELAAPAGSRSGS